MSDSKKPKAGGLLDLSTGPAPPPPAPTPRAPVTPDPDVKAGKTLNLSTGKPARRAPKPTKEMLGGGGVVVRETLDLSTKRAEPTEPAAPEPSSRAHSSRTDNRGGGNRSGGKRNDGRHRGGTRDNRSGRDDGGRGKAPAASSESLADLLSPEMLAKLRGG
ncbi:hypothetical protein [Rubrivirga sp.]|uniref:hypothetical protein n=1 Tax=Rubrivirga sp. TaxID=1885344 RepID=UPI003C7255FC